LGGQLIVLVEGPAEMLGLSTGPTWPTGPTGQTWAQLIRLQEPTPTNEISFNHNPLFAFILLPIELVQGLYGTAVYGGLKFVIAIPLSVGMIGLLIGFCPILIRRYRKWRGPPRKAEFLEPIVTKNLTKYYGKLLALDNLTIKIHKGTCVGFLGPNGAGKSTTIKILCSVIYPNKGVAYINGFNPSEEPRRAMEDIGCMIEVPEFYPHFNAEDVLRYYGKLRGIRGPELEKRVKETLELVGLSSWAKMKTSKFSRGMKQRLGVAQAMLHDPSIVILDEPSLGLDPRGIVDMRNLLKKMVKQGKTVFFASHMLYEVQEICDTVILINKGKLLVHDKVEKLEKLFKVQTIEVDLLQPPTSKQLAKVKKLESVKSCSVEKNSIKINFDGGKVAQAKLLRALVGDARLQVASFKPSVAALEEMYLHLVED
jgi:ABC-2 type transport system ATP-binding protein